MQLGWWKDIVRVLQIQISSENMQLFLGVFEDKKAE